MLSDLATLLAFHSQILPRFMLSQACAVKAMSFQCLSGGLMIRVLICVVVGSQVRLVLGAVPAESDCRIADR